MAQSGLPEPKATLITVFDPDAPNGSGWQALDDGEYSCADLTTCRRGLIKTLPAGVVQGRNDFGYAGFGGACPPPHDKPSSLSVYCVGVSEYGNTAARQ
ncbi:hypothetical protein KCP73_01965 [Salmonella enterica subsp. enterica]|nr:hypothetical protein KCP73_01965 [Salmonella enterica subsp. enterica]